MLKHRRDALADLKNSKYVFEEFEGTYYAKTEDGLLEALIDMGFSRQPMSENESYPESLLSVWSRRGDGVATIKIVKDIDLFLFVQGFIRKINDSLKPSSSWVGVFNPLYTALEIYILDVTRVAMEQISIKFQMQNRTTNEHPIQARALEHAKTQDEEKLVQILPEGQDEVAKQLEDKFNTSSKGPE